VVVVVTVLLTKVVTMVDCGVYVVVTVVVVVTGARKIDYVIRVSG